MNGASTEGISSGRRGSPAATRRPVVAGPTELQLSTGMLRASLLLLLLLLAGALSLAGSSLPLASYMKPCSRNDPNLDNCTLEHGKWAIPYLLKGDPKYSSPVLDPMEIIELKLEDVAKDNKTTGIDITMRRLKIFGLDRFELKKARFDLKNKKIDIAGNSPHVALVFEYEIEGKILKNPILGNGDGIINMTDVDLSYTNDFKLVRREDGLEYMSPGDHKFVYKTKNMNWQLDNLFNGDKTLGQFTNSFLNANWDVLNEEMGPYLSEAVGVVIKQIVTTVLKLVSYDKIFPEKV
ncbi:circadian clock-controlled protein daywake-like isoform X2 [Bacillus rossius redtenbacheri]|uniref:circadian clock-controlled protein daywake-like isoform X2 n=1 Tax=Bacillus rossius redtenbacheri TaxID=93214 RepID=UPI002FDEFC78